MSTDTLPLRAGGRIRIRLPGVGAFYVAPAMLLCLAVLVLPCLYAFHLSFLRIEHMQPGAFAGLQNYRDLIADPMLWSVVVRSAIFTAIAVSLTIAVGMAIALWIHSLKGWYVLLVQILVVLPWVISHVVGALLFRWVFVNDIGMGLYLLQMLGVSDFNPLSNGFAAMAVLIAFACWRTLGFVVILLLAGLKSIPADYYEAAHVDGANAWQRFHRITLPLLRTSLAIAIVILVLGNLNNIEAPLIVTGGGPADQTNILPLDLYARAFVNYDFGTAVALGSGMIIANVVLSILYVRLVKGAG